MGSSWIISIQNFLLLDWILSHFVFNIWIIKDALLGIFLLILWGGFLLILFGGLCLVFTNQSDFLSSAAFVLKTSFKNIFYSVLCQMRTDDLIFLNYCIIYIFS